MHLNWNEQLSAVTKKVSRGVWILRLSKTHLPIATVQRIHKSLVPPYFRHGLPVWGVIGVNAINKLEKLQNRAARNVINNAYEPVYMETSQPVTRAGLPSRDESFTSLLGQNLHPS